MSEAFDPYWKWLGISPAEQPPNHYRLLGVGLFEDDPTVLDAAAARQAARLKEHLSGSDAAAAQRLLDELAAAKLCLRNPTQRAAYERDFRKQSSMRTSSAALPVPGTPLPILPPPTALAPSTIPIPPAAAGSSLPELTTELSIPAEAQAPVLVLEPPPASPEMLRRMAEARRRAQLGLIFLSVVTALLLAAAAVLWKSGVDQRPRQALPPPAESEQRIVRVRKAGKPTTTTPSQQQKANAARESDAAKQGSAPRATGN
jgi:hypothetical protein